MECLTKNAWTFLYKFAFNALCNTISNNLFDALLHISEHTCFGLTFHSQAAESGRRPDLKGSH